MKIMKPNPDPPAENRDPLALLERSPRLLLPLGQEETSPEQNNFHMPYLPKPAISQMGA